MTQGRVVVIDPGTRCAETDSFNHIVHWSKFECTYHLPILSGAETLVGENLERVKGIVVLGGSGNLYEPLEWRSQLEKWFQKCLDRKIPTLAICWGHQWISHIFGGEVGPATPEEKKLRGFRKISMIAEGIYSKNEGEVVVSHRSMVTKRPSDVKCIGESAQFENEAFVYKDYPIYSFQSHPEATSIFLKNNSIPHHGNEDFSYGNSLVKTFLDSL